MLIDSVQEHTAEMHLIGSLRGDAPGPTIVAIGGMHGNEPTGLEAVQTLMSALESRVEHLKGEFVGVVGNLRALSEGRRYIDSDLNRMWKFRPDLRTLADPAPVYERIEMAALDELIEQIVARRRGPMIFLDLHTTSSVSAPFVICGDTLRNREFVQDFPLPKVLGLDEQLNGPFLSYLNTLGHLTLIHEAGEHTSPDSYLNHLAFLWCVLKEAGSLPEAHLPEVKNAHQRLYDQAGQDLQGFFEVRRRYAIHPDDRFRMRPGYANFQPIAEGEHLASNRYGVVNAQIKGRIFMPLYQSQGDDGYFIVSKIPDRRVRRSVYLRKMRFQRYLPYFPGIRRHPEHEHMLLVKPKFFRRLGPSLLNVLGYRKMSRQKGELLFVKRPYDLEGPSPLDRLDS